MINKQKTPEKPKVLWHKCNNIRSVKRAISQEAIGVVGIEYDVVGTADAIPLLFHDKTISRKIKKTPGENGEFIYGDLKKPIKVSKLTYDKVKKRRPDIDSLERMFQTLDKQSFSQSFEFHLEIKTPDLKVCDNILFLLQLYPKINKQTIIRSFNIDVIKYIQKTLPNQKVCLLLGGRRDIDKKADFRRKKDATAFNTLPKLQKIRQICDGKLPAQISVPHQMLTIDFISAMSGVSVEVEVYTLNHIMGEKYLYLDRIVTDYPKKILKQIAAYELKIPTYATTKDLGDGVEQFA